MQPSDSPDEAAFRLRARRWLDGNANRRVEPVVVVSSIIAEWTPDEEIGRLAEARAWQRRKFDGGWAGIGWPARYGGRDGSVMESLIFRQEELGYDVPADALAVGLDWLGRAVLDVGSEDLKQRTIPALLRGDEVWCQLFSEPGAGSDLAGLTTRAERDGDEWVITGQKVWTTLAHLADRGLLIARHDPDVAKHLGLTAFLIGMDEPGIETRPMRQMTDSANFSEVFFDAVRVPDSARVGRVGEGWRVAMSAFTHERFSDSFSNTDAIDALRLALDRSPRGSEPEMRERFVDLFVRAQALRYTGMRLLTAISQGKVPGAEGSVMKLAGPALLADIYELGLDLLGPAAALDGLDAPAQGAWNSAFLGIPGLLIGGGTPAIQRNIIGERVLGLPGDIRVDKDVPFREVPS